jgi:hypothetical protein
MAISLLKKPAATVTPWRTALDANLRAITDARTRIGPISEKDRAAQADIAAADEAEPRLAALRDEIDRQRADAAYAGNDSPDLRQQEKQLAEAEQQHKRLAAKARSAQLVRQKYAADMDAIHDEVRIHAKETNKLLWEAAREELTGLAAEFLAAEQVLLDIHKRAFAAARAVDQMSLSQSYGQFVGSGNAADLHISRPDLPCFRHAELTPEQTHAERTAYLKSIITAADALVARLLTHNA